MEHNNRLKYNRKDWKVSDRYILTLAYTSQFGFPLTKDEINKRLLSKKAVDILNEKHDFPSEIDIKIIEKNGYYTLNGYEENFSRRNKTEKIFVKRKREVQEVSQVLQKLPWVKAAAITGSFAMHNSIDTDDDIDLFIITQKNRLWLARIAVLLMAWRRGKKGLFGFGYKSNNKIRENDAWCFNLWFDENSLSIPEERRDIYTAYEICQTMWIVDLDNDCFSKKFFIANSWVKEYLPEFWDSCIKSEAKSDLDVIDKDVRYDGKDNIESGLWDAVFVLKFVNSFAFFIQKIYLKTRLHINLNNINKHQAFLHLGSLRRDVYKRWRKFL